MAYLKRKLIEDLESGTKIFVHKASLERISDETAIALHTALERFAANTLLVIRRRDDDNPAGSVSVLRDRLLVGYIDTPYAETFKDADHASWEKVLRLADRLHRKVAARPETATESTPTHPATAQPDHQPTPVPPVMADPVAAAAPSPVADASAAAPEPAAAQRPQRMRGLFFRSRP